MEVPLVQYNSIIPYKLHTYGRSNLRPLPLKGGRVPFGYKAIGFQVTLRIIISNYYAHVEVKSN